MLRINLLLLFLVVLTTACNISSLQKRGQQNLSILFEELVDKALINHIIISKEEIVFLTSSTNKELKILIGKKGDVNELLALMNKMPVGYKEEENYDVLFFDKIEKFDMKFKQFPSYIDIELITQYRKDFVWTASSGTPPPPEPSNINPYVYIYRIAENGNYVLVEEGNNINFQQGDL